MFNHDPLLGRLDGEIENCKSSSVKQTFEVVRIFFFFLYAEWSSIFI